MHAVMPLLPLKGRDKVVAGCVCLTTAMYNSDNAYTAPRNCFLQLLMFTVPCYCPSVPDLSTIKPNAFLRVNNAFADNFDAALVYDIHT